MTASARKLYDLDATFTAAPTRQLCATIVWQTRPGGCSQG